MRKLLVTLAMVGLLTALTGSVWADGRDGRGHGRGDWDRDRDRGGSRFSIGVYAPVHRPYVYTQPTYPVYVVRPAPVYVAPRPVYVQPAPVYPVYPAGTYPVYTPAPVQGGLFDGLSFIFRFGFR